MQASEASAGLARDTRLVWVALALVMAGAFVFLRSPERALKPDQAIYALAGSEVFQGSVLYRDVWELKGPLVAFAFGAVHALVGHRPVLSDVIGHLWVLFTAWTVALLARRFWGNRAAGIAAGVLLLAAALFPPLRRVNAELLAAPFVNLSMAFLLSGLRDRRVRDLALSGLFITLAISAKAVFCLDAAAAGVVLVAGTGAADTFRARARRVAGVAAGMAIGAAPFAIYFAANHALSDFWYGYIVTNLMYVDRVSLQDALRSAVAMIEGDILSLAPIFALAVAGLFTLRETPRGRPAAILGPLWFAVALVGLTMGKRFFGHYLVQPIMPAVVLGAGPLAMLVQALWEGEGAAKKLARACLVCLAVFLGIALVPRAYNAAHRWVTLPEHDEFVINEVRTAEYLREHTVPDDRIFVVGINAQLSLMTGLRPASRFLDSQFLDWHGGRGGGNSWDLWREDMRRHRPKYVVLSNYTRYLDAEPAVGESPILRDWLEENYTFETEIRGAGRARDFYNILYRRKG